VDLHADLVEAVGRNEIVAWYQPQLELSSGRIVAVESLSRWRHPSRGLLAPAQFIALAEQTDLIGEIGQYMLHDGCRCAAEWLEAGSPLEVSVNVSASQLASSDFFDDLLATLGETELPPDLLTLEITESQAIADPDDAAVRLEQLRLLGIDISIDDFGTGFSSLGQFFALPATELKIDRSLIQGEVTNGESLVSVMVGLAHERGLRVVAEGVETEYHLELARDLGCDRAQGYLIARPMPRAQLKEFMNA
jgi:EAL domain-containing protein (putative c-di-GMP-specific phosphodiesterase class I)